MSKRKKTDYIVIHCSATIEGKDFRASDIRKWHLSNKWSDIGYHYVIDLDGTVEIGRAEDEIGAGVRNFNHCSLHVCYIGGLDSEKKPKDTRTDEQKKSLELLLMNLRTRYPDAIIQGHRDFPGVSKACPCFDAKKEYEWI